MILSPEARDRSEDREDAMDLEQKTLRMGAAAILLALVLRLLSSGLLQTVTGLLSQPETAAFLLYLETGRVIRAEPVETEAPVPTTEPVQTEPENSLPPQTDPIYQPDPERDYPQQTDPRPTSPVQTKPPVTPQQTDPVYQGTEPTDPPQTDPVQTQPQETQPSKYLDPNGSYTTKEDVALYIYLYHRLPNNFVTKDEAEDLYNWSGGSLAKYGKCIGGDRFRNKEGRLPKGYTYYECDIGTLYSSSRGAKRLVFTYSGIVYYTSDHYATFTRLY